VVEVVAEEVVEVVAEEVGEEVEVEHASSLTLCEQLCCPERSSASVTLPFDARQGEKDRARPHLDLSNGLQKPSRAPRATGKIGRDDQTADP